MSGTEIQVHEAGRLAERPDDASVSAMIWHAIDRGIDVKALEQLVALEERVSARLARSAFIEAMTAFRNACPPIARTQENSQFEVTRNGVKRKARYAPLEEIDRTIRPIAAEHGLSWTWDTDIDGTNMRVICRVAHAMGHTEATSVAMPVESRAGSSPQQKYGSAQTYGMRYSLIAAFGLTTADEDVDGNGNGDDDKPETITEKQAADLSDLIESIGADAAKVKAEALQFAGVATLAEIPAKLHRRVVAGVKARKAKAEG